MRAALAIVLALAAGQSWGPLLREEGVRDARVIAAMDKVRRADFLPDRLKAREFEDAPLPIGLDQTTSQPSLIATMVEAMRLQPGCTVLEVGTGSGYQTAVLAELCAKVVSIEILPELATLAGERLRKLGYKNARVKAGDGYLGWPEHAPFDGIVVSAGAPKVPRPLIEQLKAGGRLVIPVDDDADAQELLILVKLADGGHTTERRMGVRFVPLTGSHADSDRRARE